MSDTEIVESSGEEGDELVEEIDDFEEEDLDNLEEEEVNDLEEEANLREGEVQTRMKNSGGSVVTVITRKVKVSSTRFFSLWT